MDTEREHVLLVKPDFITAGYRHDQLPTVVRPLLERLNAIPGVLGATISENGLMSGTESADDIKVEGYTPKQDQDTITFDDWVGPDYFKIVGVPILLGRGIGPQDVATSQPVAVINEAMAKFYFPGINPIGRKFVIDDEKQRDRQIEIVGVSRDVRDHDLREPIPRRFFLAYYQSVLSDLEGNFELRVAGDPNSVVEAVRRTIREFDPNVTIRSADTLETLVDDSLSQEKLVAQLSSFFGGLALLLACIGLYGVMSYAVSGRTREIGLRMALGAQRQDVLWMVLKEALILVGAGLAVGIPAAFGGSRLLLSMLYALSSVDPDLHVDLHNLDAARSGDRRLYSRATCNSGRSHGGLEVRIVESLVQDIRYGARMLSRSPVFTLVVIVTLALGIGANTAIFSVINTVLLRPLPFSQPDRVVSIFETNVERGMEQETFSPANFRDLATQNQVFSATSAYVRSPMALTGQGEPARLRVVVSTPSLFDVLE